MSESKYSYPCIYKGCEEEVPLNGGRTVRVRGYERPFSLCPTHASKFERWVREEQNGWYHANTKIPYAVCECECHVEGKEILHIMPCCKLGGHSYINTNGEVDQKKLQEVYEEVYNE